MKRQALKGMGLAGLLILVGLLALPATAAAQNIYAADTSGFLYSYDLTTNTYSDMGQLYTAGTSAPAVLNNITSMDFDSSGNLQVSRIRRVRGRFNRYYNYVDNPYQVNLGLVGGTEVNSVKHENPTVSGSAYGYFDGALTLDGQDKFFLMGFNSPDNIQAGQFGTAGLTAYNRSNYFDYIGLEWFDDGSENGTFFGLMKNNDGSISLTQLVFNYATMGWYYNFTGHSFAYPGSTAYGDLTIVGGMLYAAIGTANGSTLYSKSVLGDDEFQELGALPGQISALAGLPNQEPDPEPTPEPGTMLLLGSAGGLMAAWRRRRNKRA